MTIYKDTIRVRNTRKNLNNIKIRPGMEMVIHPYRPDEVKDIYDIMLRTSDMNPTLSERLLMEDINTEIERLKFIFDTDRIRDTTMPNKTYIGFHSGYDSKNLKDLDEFKSKAKVQFGNENKIYGNVDDNINDEYIKAKKKILRLIDEG